MLADTGAAIREQSANKFSSGNQCRQQRAPFSNPDQRLGEEITLTQALSPAASNSAKRSASL